MVGLSASKALAFSLKKPLIGVDHVLAHAYAAFLEDPKLRFPCLGLAYAALRAGGSAPAVLNAANEVAVAAFLDGRLPFLAIPVLIEATLDAMPVEPDDDLAVLRACDAAARRRARDLLPDMERA